MKLVVDFFFMQCLGIPVGLFESILDKEDKDSTQEEDAKLLLNAAKSNSPVKT